MTWTTHRVVNQVPIITDINLYDTDLALQESICRLSDGIHKNELQRYGQILGTEHVRHQAEQANRYPPVPCLWDAQGHRQDQIEFHPAWHNLLALGFSHGLHCSAWSGRPHSHTGRAAHYLLHGQIEAGTLCPMTMSSAAIPLLRDDGRFDDFVRKLHSREYDERDLPWWQKTAAMVGMGLTEKQGGSDLRGTRTQAHKIDEPMKALPDGATARQYLLTGHKWFFSSPTSDAHLVLAKHDDVLSCFFVPRYRDDGSRNRVLIQRLKDKVGNRSNASAEVEFQDASAILVGEPGRGVAQLVDMASTTRLDCVLGSSALLRQAVVQAVHHARHRSAFGKPLIRHPLMQSVLADLVLESEAATMLSLHLAAAFDDDSPLALAYRRILTPAAKFWVCKRTIQAIAECMEVLGGNGYIENGPLARLYREAPVNSIWEGSGNVMCLDVLRAQAREPELADVLFSDLSRACRDDPTLVEHYRAVITLSQLDEPSRQAAARGLTSQLVLLTQAVLLRRHAPEPVADAFIMTRFGVRAGVMGTVAIQHDASELLDRAWPE